MLTGGIAGFESSLLALGSVVRGFLRGDGFCPGI